MTDVLERIVGIVEEGSVKVIFPLILIAIAMFLLVVERSLYLFGSTWAFVWPPARRRLRDLETRVADALDTYIETPTHGTREALVDAAKRLPTPYGRFFLRLLDRRDPPTAELRDLQLAVAASTKRSRSSADLGSSRPSPRRLRSSGSSGRSRA
jgi:hypothetical protein